jgi:hypothetical protein
MSNIAFCTVPGIHRAERLICSFFEERNHRKAISRLGETDYGICHTEKLLLLNSYAVTVGCPKNNLPYPVSAPRKQDDAVQEYMGFAHSSYMEVVEVSNPTDVNVPETGYRSEDGNEEDDVFNDVNIEPLSHREQDALLSEELGDDLDIEVFANQEEYTEFLNRDTRSTDERRRVDEMEDLAVQHDRDNGEAIDQELRRLLPTSSGQPESTIDAFKQLTNQFAWIPFRNPNSETSATEIDRAEYTLYDEWMCGPNPKYSPLVQSGSCSFKAFERDWNNEVTRQFRLWSREGDNSVVQLQYKSKLLLQEYYNRLAETQVYEHNFHKTKSIGKFLTDS